MEKKREREKGGQEVREWVGIEENWDFQSWRVVSDFTDNDILREGSHSVSACVCLCLMGFGKEICSKGFKDTDFHWYL